MKEMILFLTVAMIASTASGATARLLIDGQEYTGGDIFPSDIITFIFSESVPVSGGFGDFTMNVSVGDYEADSLGFKRIGWMLPPTTVGAITVVGDGFNVFASGMGFPAPTGDLMWFEFHVPDDLEESDYIVISHILGDWGGNYNAFEDIVLHVTPEPTTIGLLGLGALSLLRRRRK